MKYKLGLIENVDLNEIWSKESQDFTPWLAQNLVLLSETLGIDLELETEEKKVGSFYADILCKNTADDSWVVIENQIVKTDHKHLGQLLTYTAGLKAKTIVWISAEFNEEHRAALDWLNENTVDSIGFFGLEVELLKIGDSLPAPRFKIISKPNDWENQVRDMAAAGSMTPSEERRVKYWTDFKNYLEQNKSKLKSSQTPRKNHYYNFGIGTTQAHLSALLITKERKIGVTLYINAKNAKAIYGELLKQKDEIQEKIGEKLEWKELDSNKKASRIDLYKPVDIDEIDNEKAWPNQFEWLKEMLEKFHDTFRPIFYERKREFKNL